MIRCYCEEIKKIGSDENKVRHGIQKVNGMISINITAREAASGIKTSCSNAFGSDAEADTVFYSKLEGIGGDAEEHLIIFRSKLKSISENLMNKRMSLTLMDESYHSITGGIEE